MINEQIYNAAIQLMAACIQSGQVRICQDTDHDHYNAYCIEKAIQLQKDVNKTV